MLNYRHVVSLMDDHDDVESSRFKPPNYVDLFHTLAEWTLLTSLGVLWPSTPGTMFSNPRKAEMQSLLCAQAIKVCTTSTDPMTIGPLHLDLMAQICSSCTLLCASGCEVQWSISHLSSWSNNSCCSSSWNFAPYPSLRSFPCFKGLALQYFSYEPWSFGSHLRF